MEGAGGDPRGAAPTALPPPRARLFAWGSQQGRAWGGGGGHSTEGAPGAGASFPPSPPAPSPRGLPLPYLRPDGRHAAGGTSHRGEAGAGSGRGPLWPRRRPPRLRGPPAAESAAARPRRAEPGRAELYLTLLLLLGRAEAARKGVSGSPVGAAESRGGCGVAVKDTHHGGLLGARPKHKELPPSPPPHQSSSSCNFSLAPISTPEQILSFSTRLYAGCLSAVTSTRMYAHVSFKNTSLGLYLR